MMHQDDKALIQRVLQGSIREFGILVERHKNLAFTMAYRMLNNREDAEEVVQDAFVKAYRNLSDFRHESRFSTWLFRIVYNTSVSRMRSKKPVFQSLDEIRAVPEISESPDQLTDNEAQRGLMLEMAIRQLSADEKTLITLYYLNESDVEEIHRITGLTRANIKVKLFRARKKMQDAIARITVNAII